MDLYFVANRTNQRITTPCTFRVSERKPELWNPVDGTIRRLPEYSRGERPHPNSAAIRAVSELLRGVSCPDAPQSLPTAHGDEELPCHRTGRRHRRALECRVRQAAGGPGNLEFHDARGLESARIARRAAFRRTSPPIVARSTSRPLSGPASGTNYGWTWVEVQVSWRDVRLNGRDLGVVWTAPWSVDISQAVRDRDNQLEIDVANLWPNRLIGDAALPPPERHSWTTWSPYQPTDPLLPPVCSGQSPSAARLGWSSFQFSVNAER